MYESLKKHKKRLRQKDDFLEIPLKIINFLLFLSSIAYY